VLCPPGGPRSGGCRHLRHFGPRGQHGSRPGRRLRAVGRGLVLVAAARTESVPGCAAETTEVTLGVFGEDWPILADEMSTVCRT